MSKCIGEKTILYERTKKGFNSYVLIRDANALKGFRTKEMREFKGEEKCFSSEEPFVGYHFDYTAALRKAADNGIIVTSDYLKSSSTTLRRNTDKQDCLSFVEYYCEGKASEWPVVRLNLSGRERYMILSLQKDAGHNICKISDILEIPKKLYLLQLLEQGKFKTLDGEDLSEILGLYSLKQTSSMTCDEISRASSFGIASEDALESINKKAEEDKYLLKSLI